MATSLGAPVILLVCGLALSCSSLSGHQHEPSAALSPADENIMRRNLFHGVMTGSSDLAWYLVAVVIPVRPSTPDSDRPYFERWSELASAFNSLVAPGRAGFDGSVSLAVRTLNEDAVLALGPRPSRLELQEFVYGRLLAEGILARMVALADSRGSRTVETVPEGYVYSDDRRREESGVTAVEPAREYRYRCEANFRYCATMRSVILFEATTDYAACRKAYQEAISRGETRADFLAKVAPVLARGAEVDVYSSQAIAAYMNEFIAALEGSGLAEVIDERAMGREP
jgi:hypothetical protein